MSTRVYFVLVTCFLIISGCNPSPTNTGGNEVNTLVEPTQVNLPQPSVRSICYSLSDTTEDEFSESGDYFAWNPAFEKCDSPITESEIREYRLSQGIKYCRYPQIRIVVAFDNVNQLDIKSVGVFEGDRAGLLSHRLTDTLHFYDYLNGLTDSELTKYGIFTDDKYVITIIPDNSKSSGAMSDEEKKRLWGPDGNFDATVYFKSTTGEEYREQIILPYMNPHDCEAEE